MVEATTGKKTVKLLETHKKSDSNNAASKSDSNVGSGSNTTAKPTFDDLNSLIMEKLNQLESSSNTGAHQHTQDDNKGGKSDQLSK